MLSSPPSASVTCVYSKPYMLSLESSPPLKNLQDGAGKSREAARDGIGPDHHRGNPSPLVRGSAPLDLGVPLALFIPTLAGIVNFNVLPSGRELESRGDPNRSSLLLCSVLDNILGRREELGYALAVRLLDGATWRGEGETRARVAEEARRLGLRGPGPQSADGGSKKSKVRRRRQLSQDGGTQESGQFDKYLQAVSHLTRARPNPRRASELLSQLSPTAELSWTVLRCCSLLSSAMSVSGLHSSSSSLPELLGKVNRCRSLCESLTHMPSLSPSAMVCSFVYLDILESFYTLIAASLGVVRWLIKGSSGRCFLSSVSSYKQRWSSFVSKVSAGYMSVRFRRCSQTESVFRAWINVGAFMEDLMSKVAGDDQQNARDEPKIKGDEVSSAGN